MATHTGKLEWVTNVSVHDLKSRALRLVNGVQGEPMATEQASARQLSDAGMVGIYRQEGAEFRIDSKLPGALDQPITALARHRLGKPVPKGQDI